MRDDNNKGAVTAPLLVFGGRGGLFFDVDVEVVGEEVGVA